VDAEQLGDLLGTQAALGVVRQPPQENSAKSRAATTYV
jgi:hypothetical protein